MKILVTGGAGLVGSHTAEYYSKKGDEVIVLDNLMRSNLFGYNKESVEFNWNYLSQLENVKRIKGDVREEKDVMKALGDGVDAVIHTAGQPGVPLSMKIPREDFSINAYGTLNVLECLRQVSPKAAFVYCSTNKIYGENVDSITLEEEETRYRYKTKKGVPETLSVDLTGHTPYGASKYTGDIYTQEYGHIYGMKTAVFRMSCLSGNTRISTQEGNIKIKEMVAKKKRIFCFNGENLSTQHTKGAFLTSRSNKKLYKVKTERGYSIEATGDHKFFTPGGYIQLDKILYGSLVAVSPESFYKYRKPVESLPNKKIISEETYVRSIKRYGRKEKSNLEYLGQMKNREIIPLAYNNPNIYVIARLVGYLTGDAHLYHRIKKDGKSYTEIQVYALKKELEAIKEDFRKLGFTPGKTRISDSTSELLNGHVIEGRSHKFSVTTTDAFCFFEILGVPVGNKSKIKFEVPDWIMKAPKDVQDEYLSGLFGAELSRPRFYKRKRESSLDLQPLQFSQSKNKELSSNAKKFRSQIVSMLKKRKIDIKTYENSFFYKKGGDVSICFQFAIKPSRKNFMRFARIGYAFNRERNLELYRIIEFMKTDYQYTYYYKWLRENTHMLDNSGLIWDKLISKKEIPMSDIYDITVPVHHNFVANGFLVHNCIYGTRQFGFEDQGWVAWFVIANLTGQPIIVYGDGKQVRDLLYVDDLVEAYDKFIQGEARHDVFNIGGGPRNTTSLLEFIALIEKKTGIKFRKIEHKEWRPSDQKVYISDIGKVSKSLSWKPKATPEKGLEKLIEWVGGNTKYFI